MFNLSWDRTYINQSSSCRFEFEFLWPYLYRSTIFLSVCVQFELGSYLYLSIIVLSVWVWVFWAGPISIDHLPVNLCLVLVFGTTPISIGYSSCQFSFWDCIYIDRSFILSIQFPRPHLYWSVISMSVQFLGLYLYWSVIHLVSSVFGIAPISIGHLPVSLCSVWVFRTTLILIGHSSCQFKF